MSTNYRAYQVNLVSGSTALGNGSAYPKVWGIMKGQGSVNGSVSLQGGGSIDLNDLDVHQIFPCYPKSITINAGGLYILS
jgi:hypothetical protein